VFVILNCSKVKSYSGGGTGVSVGGGTGVSVGGGTGVSVGGGTGVSVGGTVVGVGGTSVFVGGTTISVDVGGMDIEVDDATVVGVGEGSVAVAVFPPHAVSNILYIIKIEINLIRYFADIGFSFQVIRY
jgi:hypothetical protein